MKRTVSSILIFVIMICMLNCAIATDNYDFSDVKFNIRGGVGFMSTLYEVKELEDANPKLELFDLVDKYRGWEGYYKLYYTGEIAGYPNGRVEYYFDSPTQPGNLLWFDYKIGGNGDGELKYNQVKEDLSNRYGAPDILDVAYSTTSIPLFMRDPSTNMVRFSQWFVEFSDCDVVITLWWGSGYGNTYCFLYYDLYSHDEMQTLRVNYQERLNDINKQRQTDF